MSVCTACVLSIINLAQLIFAGFHLEILGDQGTRIPKDRVLAQTLTKLLVCAWLSDGHQCGHFVSPIFVDHGNHKHHRHMTVSVLGFLV